MLLSLVLRLAAAKFGAFGLCSIMMRKQLISRMLSDFLFKNWRLWAIDSQK
jgi:hypothetical protein